MKEYAKTKVNSQISVSSIVTVFHVNLSEKRLHGESHDFPEIFYLEKGNRTISIDDIPIEVSAGQLVIYAPKAFHGEKIPTLVPECEVGIISFETESPLPQEYLNRAITLTGKQRVELSAIIQEAVPLFETRKGTRGMLLKSHASLYTLQSIKNRLELFLLELISPGENLPMSQMNRITDYMMQNIGSAPQLQQIAKELGMSAATIKRIVEQTCGMPPKAYFISLQIEEAKRLLSETPMNVTEISQMLGFSSVHYFSRLFKSKTGMTPTEYRCAKTA